VTKGKSFRESGRRFDDDGSAPRRPGRIGRQGAFAAAAPDRRSGPPIIATVKWFNAEKGFGFVELQDGSGDAFLHVAVLARSGYEGALSPGTILNVRIGSGQKGPQVTEILSVDETPDANRGVHRAANDLSTSGGLRVKGTVKWYNAERGFGFITVDGGKEVFVHATALQRSRMTGLSEGQQVSLDVAPGRKGLEAVSISSTDAARTGRRGQ